MTTSNGTISHSKKTNREDSPHMKRKTNYYTNKNNYQKHRQTNKSIIRNVPNYNNTILHKTTAYTRYQQFTQATKQQHDKLQQRQRQCLYQAPISPIDSWIGDEMNYHDDWIIGDYTDTIRICTININGISQDLDWIEWDMTLRSMKKLQIDALGITEPNINFKNKHVTNKLYDTAKAFERNMQLYMSCSNQLNKSTKKRWHNDYSIWKTCRP